MLSQKNKIKNSLGSIVSAYLTRVSESPKTKINLEQETAKFFDLLSNSIDSLLKKVIRYNGLSRVVTDNQIDLSKAELLNQIVTEPAKYETLIKNIQTNSNTNSLDREKELNRLKAEFHVSSKIREFYLLEEKPEQRINSYLYKVALTILKNNAEGISKDYILLNNNVKKSLKELALKGSIFEPIKGRYSSNKNETIIFYSNINNIKTNYELDSELVKSKPNLKKSIMAILAANCCYNFSPKDISTYIAKIMFERKTSLKIAKQYKEDEEEQNYTECEIIVEKDYISKVSAIESMKELIKSQNSSKAIAQTEMALLAYLYRASSGYYFHLNILTDEQMELEETTCIEKFLNDKAFCNFNKSKPIGRTTAFYRKTQGLIALKNILADLSAETQSVFVREYSAYLEKRYKYYRGEAK